MAQSFNSYKKNILTDIRSNKLNFKSDDRNYYVYRITNIITNLHYYGSRVTKLDPKDDLGIKYFSSSSDKNFIIEQNIIKNFKYKVIKIFNNPGDQCLYESYLHQYFQVNSNDKFINKSKCMPFGFSIAGNRDSIKKMITTRKIINKETGLNSFQLGAIKANNSKNKLYKNTNLTIREIGINKGLKTKGIINKKTGLTIFQSSSIKAAATMNIIDKKTGLTKKQLSINKAKRTSSTINDVGLTGYEQSRITQFKINSGTNLNSYETGAKKRKGKNNIMFKGYYITPWGNFVSTTETMEQLNIKAASTVITLCKHNKLITNRSYKRMKVFQKLGTPEEIVGKTTSEIGFNFSIKKT